MNLPDAADENLAVHATASTWHLPGARVRHTPELVVVDSGLPCDTFNFICRARLSSDEPERHVREAIAFFAKSGHPFSWWLGPGASPVYLSTLLEDAGLGAAESELAMGMPLSRLKAPEKPAGFEVRRVSSAEDLATFARLSAANWSPPDEQVIHYYKRAETYLLRSDSPQWLYIGTLDGVPVATAELTESNDVVGLYNIATIPAARGRGIGSVMTAQPLLAARASGHTTAVLQASAAGQNLYARRGFTAFGEITEYKPA